MVRLSQNLDDIVLTHGADCSGVFRHLPKSAFQFEHGPQLPPVYRIPASAIFHETMENGLCRDGPVPMSFVDSRKIQNQLFPTLPYFRFLIGQFEGYPDIFANKLGFNMPDCCQNDEDFMSDILTNFPCETFGGAKDEIIRGLCSFIREILVEHREEYVPKLKRKFHFQIFPV